MLGDLQSDIDVRFSGLAHEWMLGCTLFVLCLVVRQLIMGMSMLLLLLLLLLLCGIVMYLLVVMYLLL
jgi:hypothetical protein